MRLGLKETSISVYITILRMGSGNITDIAKKTGIKRTTTYQYLEELLEKGLIQQTKRGKRLEYAATHPRSIVSYLEKEKRSLDYTKNRINAIIPELESLYAQSASKPNIVTYEGRRGLIAAYEEIFNTWQDIYTIYSPEAFFSLFSKEENHALLMKVKEHEITIHNLIEKSEAATEQLNMKEYVSFVKNKTLSTSMKFQSDLLVTGDKLALISFENRVAVVITDKAIADMQRTFLTFVWKSL